MLLKAEENGAGAKSDTPPDEWFKEKDPEYSVTHLIPPDPALWQIDRFEDFVTERKKLTKEKFAYLLSAPTVHPLRTNLKAFRLTSHEPSEEQNAAKMKPQARELALGILTRIKEREGTANKTKLLKLLYLADIEQYRASGETLTGFDWIFYLYGPWTNEYDALLRQLQEESAIEVRPWVSGGVDGERIIPIEEFQLARAIPSTQAFLRTMHLVDIWADRGVPTLLDYVYFETESMRDARKMERLDFSKVSKEPPRPYRRTKSGTDPRELRRLKARFVEERKKLSSENYASYEQAP
jgi:hypothetical protein